MVNIKPVITIPEGIAPNGFDTRRSSTQQQSFSKTIEVNQALSPYLSAEAESTPLTAVTENAYDHANPALIAQYESGAQQRPAELAGPEYDVYWQSSENLREFDWQSVTSKRRAAFADWLQRGMPLGSNLSHGDRVHIGRLAVSLGYADMDTMRLELKAPNVLSSSEQPLPRPDEFNSKAFALLFGYPLIRDFDWQNLTVENDRQVFAEWVNTGMPFLSDISDQQGYQIKRLAELFGYDGAHDMREHFLEYLNGDDLRPEQFYGAVFDALWEDPGFRGSVDWAQLQKSHLTVFSDWVRSGLLLVNEFTDSDIEASYLNQTAQLMGYENTAQMRQALYPLLPLEMRRPKELQNEFFDTLWEDPRIQQLNWSTVSDARKRIFANWYQDGMPGTSELTNQHYKQLSDLARSLNMGRLANMRPELWLTLPSEMRRLPEFQGEAMDRYWNLESIQSLNWMLMTKGRREIFARWLTSDMPVVSHYNATQRTYLNQIAVALGYPSGTSEMRQGILQLLLPEGNWRPQELASSEFDRLWALQSVGDSNWMVISEGRRLNFANWLREGMPTGADFSGDKDYVAEVGKALGFEGIADMRDKLWPYIPAQWRRPDKLKDPMFDSLWALQRIQDVNWVSVGTPRRFEAFVKWLQLDGESKNKITTSEAGLILDVARSMDFDNAAQMHFWLRRHVSPQLGGVGANTHFSEFHGEMFANLWEQARFRDFDWQNLSSSEQRQTFVNWINDGMPEIQELTVQEAQHIEELVELLAYNSVDHMQQELDDYINTRSIRPEIFTGAAFDALWEDSGFRDSIDWNTISPKRLSTFATWIHDRMPNPISTMSDTKRKQLTDFARALGSKDIHGMRINLTALLPAELRRPEEFEDPVFDGLWSNRRIRNFNWQALAVTEKSATTRRGIFVEWLRNGMPRDQYLEPTHHTYLGELAHDLGFTSFSEMRIWLKRILPVELGGILNGIYDRPSEFNDETFRRLWDYALIRDFDWNSKTSAEQRQSFADWINEGINDVDDLPVQQREHIEQVASLLGYDTIGRLAGLLEGYLETVSHRPAEFHGTAFDALWNDSEFRNLVDWDAVPVSDINEFVNWVHSGVPGSRLLDSTETERITALANTLGFSAISKMRNMVGNLLSETTTWPSEFVGPLFNLLRTDERFMRNDWVWEFISADSRDVFIQWVSDGAPPEAEISDRKAIDRLQQIAKALGYDSFSSMRNKDIGLGSYFKGKYRDEIKEISFSGSSIFVDYEQRKQAGRYIAQLAKTYGAGLTLSESGALLALVEYADLSDALVSARLELPQFTLRINSAIKEFRSHPDQFADMDSFRDYLFINVEYRPALLRLAQQQGAGSLSIRETDALLAAFHHGPIQADQVNAWQHTPLTAQQYDKYLQQGLGKLQMSFAEFFQSMQQAVYQLEADLMYPVANQQQGLGLRGEPSVDPDALSGTSPESLLGGSQGANTNTGFSTTPFSRLDPNFNPNGLIGPEGTQAGHNGGKDGKGTRTAVAADENPFSNSIPDNVPLELQSGLDNISIPKQVPGWMKLPVDPERPAAPAGEAGIPVVDTSAETQSISPQEGGTTWGGQLGSASDAEQARQQMEDIFGKGWSQGVRPDLFPTPIDPRIPGFGEGLPPPSLDDYNTSWGLPDAKIHIENETFPQRDEQLENILRPNGEAGPTFIFPRGTDHDHLPKEPEEMREAVINALPELQSLSYAQYSQLSIVDQQQIIRHTQEYQQLSPSDKTNVSLIDYLDSRQVSPAQRQQLQQQAKAQTMHEAKLNVAEAQTGLDSSTTALINARIKALQANIAQINRHTQAIQQSNAERLSALTTQAKTDPMGVAFINPEPSGSQSPASTPVRPAEINTAINQNSPIPRFMVIRSQNGPQLMENLPNGQTQLHHLPLAADTPITRQLPDGRWSGVPDVGQIGGKLFLDLLFTQGALKMLNNGGPVNAPQAPNNAPSQPAPETIPQPAF